MRTKQQNMQFNTKIHKSHQKMMLFVFILITILLFTSTIKAQESQISFYSLDINFWPEYDAESMLVKYKGILDPSTTLPIELEFRLPFNSTLMNYIAVENLSGQKIYLPYEVILEGQDQVVKFTVDTLQFEFTYYDQSLSKISNQRFYNTDLQINYLINDLNLIFQEPESVEEMQISPEPDSLFVGQYNLNYHVVDLGEFQTNEQIEIIVNYFKDNDDLTFNYVEPILPDQINNKNFLNKYIIPIIISISIITIILMTIYLLNVERIENRTIRRNLRNSNRNDSKKDSSKKS